MTREVLMACAVLGAAAPAGAQEAPAWRNVEMPRAALPVAAPAPEPPAKREEFTGDLSFVNTAGNTQITTLSLGNRLRLRRGAWTLNQSFGFIYGEDRGQRNTEIWRAGVRADRLLRPHLAGYAISTFDRNTLGGFSSRVTVTAGLGWQALRTAPHALLLEAGGGHLWQQNVGAAADERSPIARVAGTYRYTFRKDTYAQQVVEFLPNLRTAAAWRLNSESALVAPLSRALALKASYVIRYDNRPPGTFQRSDRLLTTGIQLTL
ncbi:MAG: DUF481 domain-containing protein [Gemmatimonadales bacterium]|nr:DUF481 domain-containing protein [Gemmatimonadales bacterium]